MIVERIEVEGQWYMPELTVERIEVGDQLYVPERIGHVVVSHGDHGQEPRFEGDAWTARCACSVCGGTIGREDRWCRHCGARMERHEVQEAAGRR